MSMLNKLAMASVATLLSASPAFAAVPVYDVRVSGTTNLITYAGRPAGGVSTVELTGTLAGGNSTINDSVITLGGFSPIQLGTLTFYELQPTIYGLTGANSFRLQFNSGETTDLSTLIASFSLPGGNYVDSLSGEYGRRFGADAFEFIRGSATITATLSSAVPEPTTWVMMIFGFGAVGYSIRRKRAQVRVTYA